MACSCPWDEPGVCFCNFVVVVYVSIGCVLLIVGPILCLFVCVCVALFLYKAVFLGIVRKGFLLLVVKDFFSSFCCCLIIPVKTISLKAVKVTAFDKLY